MTGDNTATPISLSEKLSVVTHHHLLTRVSVKLDLDDWNYGQWDYFFVQLCESYDIDKVVVESPKSAKEAWILISDIVKDNKRSRTNTLKADLDDRVHEEDVVHYALEGLLDTYNQVCGYMHWKDTFPDLKAVRSLLIAEEMRLKSKVLASTMDSSTPMGNCRYGDSWRYVHDANARVPNATSRINKDRGTSENSINELLNKLLAQLGKLGMNMLHTSTNTIAPTISLSISPAQNSSIPIAYYASPSPTAPAGPSALPGLPMQTQVPLYYTSGPTQPVLAQSTSTLGQDTVLPHAFNAETLQDPSFDA
nr:hybrid signal transduction histidine kinase M [Tanacetum cinerariifolium]